MGLLKSRLPFSEDVSEDTVEATALSIVDVADGVTGPKETSVDLAADWKEISRG